MNCQGTHVIEKQTRAKYDPELFFFFALVCTCSCCVLVLCHLDFNFHHEKMEHKNV